MRLSKVRSTNEISLNIIKDVTINGRRTTKVVESLGTERSLKEKLGVDDPYPWIKNYIASLNEQEREGKRKVTISYSPDKLIEKNQQVSYNCGYLFLQCIYNQLGLDKICHEIQDKYKITYSINEIMSRLVYSRILFPASKTATYELSQKYLEAPKFKSHQIFRAMDCMYDAMDFIQAELYKNSNNVYSRNTRVLFYDCTNFYFATEQEEGIKQYGLSKDHQPAPIVQMGLFMDANGIPLAMSITPGNMNEQGTLKPLEQKIIKDFGLSEIVVCTDAGLASHANRKFNNMNNRSYITTQSLKKLKSHLKDWVFEDNGWKLFSSHDDYNLTDIIDSLNSEEDEDLYNKKLNRIYYKERWINENGLEQRLIVTYSPKTAVYQHNIRLQQIERAEKAIKSGAKKLKSKNANDYRRFIDAVNSTKDGQPADNTIYTINQSSIEKEQMYDGFYGVCTNLEDDVMEIIKINKGRWEIEESFRIMKSDFKSRPIFHQNDDRIKTHFLTCYISLLVFRLLEKKLNDKYTVDEIISTLKDMNMHKIRGEGYLPSYMATELTDLLHETFGFRTDYQIVTNHEMKKIIKITKN